MKDVDDMEDLAQASDSNPPPPGMPSPDDPAHWMKVIELRLDAAAKENSKRFDRLEGLVLATKDQAELAVALGRSANARVGDIVREQGRESADNLLAFKKHDDRIAAIERRNTARDRVMAVTKATSEETRRNAEAALKKQQAELDAMRGDITAKSAAVTDGTADKVLEVFRAKMESDTDLERFREEERAKREEAERVEKAREAAAVRERAALALRARNKRILWALGIIGFIITNAVSHFWGRASERPHHEREAPAGTPTAGHS